MKIGKYIMQDVTKNDIRFASDIIVKALCGVCTILLGIAVQSINTMSEEIKDLSVSVNTLSVSSSLVVATQKTLHDRLVKMEDEKERLKEMIRLQTIDIAIIKKGSKK